MGLLGLYFLVGGILAGLCLFIPPFVAIYYGVKDDKLEDYLGPSIGVALLGAIALSFIWPLLFVVLPYLGFWYIMDQKKREEDGEDSD